MDLVGRSVVGLVWLGGVALAAVLYLIGPGSLIAASLAAVSRLEWAIANSIAFLSAQTFDLVRAAAIALFVVFLVLGALAKQRGAGRGSSGLVGLTVLFVVLITLGGYQSRFCWFAALLVAGAGAISMTQRLLNPPLRGPWGPGTYRRGGESHPRP